MILRRTLKIVLFSAAGFAGLVLLLMLALKLALDRVPQYQAQIKDWVFRRTGYHIAFAHVWPALHWYGPELTFDDFELRSSDGLRVLARARRGRIGTDVWQLLQNGKLFALRIELDAPSLSIARLGPDRFALASEIVWGAQGSSISDPTLNDLPAGTLVIRRGRDRGAGLEQRIAPARAARRQSRSHARGSLPLGQRIGAVAAPSSAAG